MVCFLRVFIHFSLELNLQKPNAIIRLATLHHTNFLVPRLPIYNFKLNAVPGLPLIQLWIDRSCDLRCPVI